MINQGFFLRPQSGAAQRPQTSKMHPVCAALSLIQIEHPFNIVLLGIKSIGGFVSSVGWIIFFFKILQSLAQIDQPYQFPELFELIFYTHIIQHLGGILI